MREPRVSRPREAVAEWDVKVPLLGGEESLLGTVEPHGTQVTTRILGRFCKNRLMFERPRVALICFDCLGLIRWHGFVVYFVLHKFRPRWPEDFSCCCDIKAISHGCPS